MSRSALDVDDLDHSGKIGFMTFQNFLGPNYFSVSIFQWYVDLAFLRHYYINFVDFFRLSSSGRLSISLLFLVEYPVYSLFDIFI